MKSEGIVQQNHRNTISIKFKTKNFHNRKRLFNSAETDNKTFLLDTKECMQKLGEAINKKF